MISNLNELVRCSQEPVVEFIASENEWKYSACAARVTISIDGNWVKLPENSLISGGSVYFDDEIDDITKGDWKIWDSALPEHLRFLKPQIEKVINENLWPGCCGGCL